MFLYMYKTKSPSNLLKIRMTIVKTNLLGVIVSMGKNKFPYHADRGSCKFANLFVTFSWKLGYMHNILLHKLEHFIYIIYYYTSLNIL